MQRLGVLVALALHLMPGTWAFAQELALVCDGHTLGWQLRLDGNTASLSFGTVTQMDVMDDTTADGAEWPRALTLIGNRDTGILILEPRACTGDPDADFNAELLTQRGQTPILLTGCCRVVE